MNNFATNKYKIVHLNDITSNQTISIDIVIINHFAAANYIKVNCIGTSCLFIIFANLNPFIIN